MCSNPVWSECEREQKGSVTNWKTIQTATSAINPSKKKEPKRKKRSYVHKHFACSTAFFTFIIRPMQFTSIPIFSSLSFNNNCIQCDMWIFARCFSFLQVISENSGYGKMMSRLNKANWTNCNRKNTQFTFDVPKKRAHSIWLMKYTNCLNAWLTVWLRSIYFRRVLCVVILITNEMITPWTSVTSSYRIIPIKSRFLIDWQ